MTFSNDVNSGTFEYVGTGAAGNVTIKDFGGTDYYNLVINDTNAGGSQTNFRLSGNALVIAGALMVSSSTYDANGQATTVAGLATVAGGKYTAGTALQKFDGGLTVTSGTFYGGAGSIDVNGNVTIDGGGLRGSSDYLYVSGNWTDGGAFTHNSGTVEFDGGVNKTLNAGSGTFYNVVIAKTAGAQLTQQTNAANFSNSFIITSGTFYNTAPLTVASTRVESGGKFQQGADLTTGTVNILSGGTWANSSDGDITLSGDVSNAGAISFNATSSAGIKIWSSVSGTQRNWQGRALLQR